MRIPIDRKQKVVAFDPGEHTGVIVINKGEVVESATVTPEELEYGLRQGRWNDADAWVIEDFVLYPWVAQQMGFDRIIPARLIGMLGYAANVANVPTVLFSAGTVKPFSTDSKLSQLGWIENLNTPHEKDAARHALYYLIKGFAS